jgi:hypothetical protein
MNSHPAPNPNTWAPRSHNTMFFRTLPAPRTG